jgi:hyperosmotically inducible periplasmic protein
MRNSEVRMKTIGFVLLAGVMAMSSTLTAKDKQHIDPYVNGPVDEGKLIQEIRHKLVMLPYYGIFDDLGFTVNGGMVTLEGSVTQPGFLKDNAEKTVKEVEGVTSVVNNIEVLPLSANDDRIRRAVYRAVYGDPALSTRLGYRAVPSLHIIVKNGHVRLEGVVANQFDSNLARIRANGVSGVFSVDNELQIEGK